MGAFNMKVVEDTFNRAREAGAKYVCVAIEMEGWNMPELIINPIENMEGKLLYYKRTYRSEDCVHKHSPGIRIFGVSYGHSSDDLGREFNLIGGTLDENK